MINAISTEAVNGAYGETITLRDLPSPDLRRWKTRDKFAVIAAIIGGLISHEQACERYALSPQEIGEWWRAMEKARLTHTIITEDGSIRTPRA